MNAHVKGNAMTQNRYLEKLKSFLTVYFSKDDVKIILFGSRGRSDNYPASDIDIGLIPGKEFKVSKIAFLEEKIDCLNIPHKVEIVNLNETSKEFKNQVLKDGIIWKD